MATDPCKTVANAPRTSVANAPRTSALWESAFLATALASLEITLSTFFSFIHYHSWHTKFNTFQKFRFPTRETISSPRHRAPGLNCLKPSSLPYHILKDCTFSCRRCPCCRWNRLTQCAFPIPLIRPVHSNRAGACWIRMPFCPHNSFSLMTTCPSDSPVFTHIGVPLCWFDWWEEYLANWLMRIGLREGLRREMMEEGWKAYIVSRPCSRWHLFAIARWRLRCWTLSSWLH